MNTEYWFRNPHSSNPTKDGNGFFIRDDIDNNYIYNNWFYFDDIYYDWKVVSLLSQYINIENGVVADTAGEKLRVQMSQDQCWHLYTGFALVAKLLNGVVLTSSSGATYNFSDRVKSLTNNIQYQLSGANKSSIIPNISNWITRNPVNNVALTENMGGEVFAQVYGFGIAGSKIVQKDLHIKGSASDYAKTVFMGAWQYKD